jgi:hypothetical protein
VAEEHVGDAFALAAGQPGRHQRVHLGELVGQDHPTSLPAVGAEASSLKVTRASGATWRMP